MQCGKCGSPNADFATHCSSCGSALANPYATPQAGGGLPPGVKISNYLVASIVLTLCCCPPLGIASAVYAAQANTRLEYGDYLAAQEASRKAKLWFWVGLGFGVVWFLLVVGLQVASVAMAINEGGIN